MTDTLPNSVYIHMLPNHTIFGPESLDDYFSHFQLDAQGNRILLGPETLSDIAARHTNAALKSDDELRWQPLPEDTAS